MHISRRAQNHRSKLRHRRAAHFVFILVFITHILGVCESTLGVCEGHAGVGLGAQGGGHGGLGGERGGHDAAVRKGGDGGDVGVDRSELRSRLRRLRRRRERDRLRLRLRGLWRCVLSLWLRRLRLIQLLRLGRLRRTLRSGRCLKLSLRLRLRLWGRLVGSLRLRRHLALPPWLRRLLYLRLIICELKLRLQLLLVCDDLL